jgi:DNA invertase Pin-like site-specific DNA recombinase
MIFTVLSAVAELERSLITERVAMGLERARKEGKPHGRPKRIFDREKAQQLRDQGKSLREIGTILGVNKGTVAASLD